MSEQNIWRIGLVLFRCWNINVACDLRFRENQVVREIAIRLSHVLINIEIDVYEMKWSYKTFGVVLKKLEDEFDVRGRGLIITKLAWSNDHVNLSSIFLRPRQKLLRLFYWPNSDLFLRLFFLQQTMFQRIPRCSWGKCRTCCCTIRASKAP